MVTKNFETRILRNSSRPRLGNLMVSQEDTHSAWLPYGFLHRHVFALVNKFQPTFIRA